MKIAIMQPYFFPYIGYFQLINAVDKFVIYDDVNFIKNGWINRNRILINGKDNYLTVHLKDASSFKLINNVNFTGNRNKLIKTIQQTYIKAPYFKDVYSIIEKVLTYECNLISELAHKSIIEVLAYLNIDTEIIVSSEKLNYTKNYKNQERIIAICKELGATHYINANGGQELYNKEIFANEGIELNFIKSQEIKYKQFNNEFISWLSIIDVLMFNSKETVRQMLSMHELV